LWQDRHSDVRGSAKDPHRILLNFSVNDVKAESGRLKTAGVPLVRDAYEEPGVGMFATFVDPDGNYCQLVHLYE
jgi:predicted enzyme related to lactoylglutathione lyase